MKVVVFLQNAWSRRHAGGAWPRPAWLAALRRSRSGKRLCPAFDQFEPHYDNTTPRVGSTPDSVEKPDAEHIAAVLEAHRPSVVVACGRQAEAALVEFWPGPLLVVPHPAHRVVTNELFQYAAWLVKCELREPYPPGMRIALRQLRGRLEVEELQPTEEP